MTAQDLMQKHPALKVPDPEYLNTVLAFAEKRGKLDNLVSRLDQIAGGTFFGAPKETFLYRDFAPNSFYFEMVVTKKDGNKCVGMNGGVIYYGPGDGGSDAPQFSVRMENEDREGWSVHT